MKVVIYINLILIVCKLDAQEVIKSEIFIGDKIPDIEITQIINFPKNKARISDFNGKVLLIGFWAPWCSPCISSFEKLNNLQERFREDFQVLLVTQESKVYAEKLLNTVKQSKGIKSLTSVVEDTVFFKKFGHQTIPHYVWIDKAGIVQAITGSEEVTEQNIERFVKGNKLDLPVKADYSIDLDKPFFMNNNNKIKEFESELSNYSVFTNYLPNVGTVSVRRENSITLYNHSINMLINLAFGGFRLTYLDNKKLILEGFSKEDSLKIGLFSEATKDDWNEIKYENMYTYEMYTSTNYDVQKLLKILEDDVKKFVETKGFLVYKDIKMDKSLSLERTAAKTLFKSKGGESEDHSTDLYVSLKNKPILYFISKMQMNSPLKNTKIENRTGYFGNIDIELKLDSGDLKSINNELYSYGLILVERETQSLTFTIRKLGRNQISFIIVPKIGNNSLEGPIVPLMINSYRK